MPQRDRLLHKFSVSAVCEPVPRQKLIFAEPSRTISVWKKHVDISHTWKNIHSRTSPASPIIISNSCNLIRIKQIQRVAKNLIGTANAKG